MTNFEHHVWRQTFRITNKRNFSTGRKPRLFLTCLACIVIYKLRVESPTKSIPPYNYHRRSGFTDFFHSFFNAITSL